MTESVKKERQVLTLTDRSSVEVNCVEAILSFDEDYIDIMTSLGKISIEGSDLKVLDLSRETGRISVSGSVKSVIFSDNSEKKKRGLFG